MAGVPVQGASGELWSHCVSWAAPLCSVTAGNPVRPPRRPHEVEAWEGLTDDERDALVQYAALAFLDRPPLQGCTAARLRRETDPHWQLVADAMDAESAVRSARGGFQVVSGGRRLPPVDRERRPPLRLCRPAEMSASPREA